MTIKAYQNGKAPRFDELKHTPVHLGEIDGCHHYAFPKGMTSPKGGKTVKDYELKDILKQSPILSNVKIKAAERILDIAPLWRQQNALSDLVRLQSRSDLSAEEQNRLEEAETLIASVEAIRERSNQIEMDICEGKMIDLEVDATWEISQNA
jgi:hypothetical protein